MSKQTQRDKNTQLSKFKTMKILYNQCPILLDKNKISGNEKVPMAILENNLGCIGLKNNY